MLLDILLSLAGVLAMLPALLFKGERENGTAVTYWLVLAVAVAGPAVKAISLTTPQWHSGLDAALWMSIAATLALFALLALCSTGVRRVTRLLVGYLFLLGLIGLAVPAGTGQTRVDIWLAVHILISLSAYALLTVAAILALGVFLKERALRAKRSSDFTRELPPVASAETLQVRFLLATAVVLACGIFTGILELYVREGQLLAFNHKIVLSLTAFAVIAVLVAAQMRAGLRGRMVAQTILLAFLLVTLSYPGVKFVTDVVLS